MATGTPVSMAAEVLPAPPISPDNTLDLEEEFTIRVLDSAAGRQVSGWGAIVTGRRLVAKVSEYLTPDTCVRIECRDGLLLGETQACWREGTATFVAVGLSQALMGLKELARLREQRWGFTRSLEPRVRQRA